ncbi:MAG: hypothetical protein IJZ34_15275 [Lachnospiraceae bacterium]|nr:hypothetical protein [Lachnospiraceae bacterium]
MITMLAFSSCSGDSATVPDAAETSEATDKNEATEATGTEVVTAATELSEPTANKHPEVGTYVLITPETMSGYETETADDVYTYIKRNDSHCLQKKTQD